MAVGLKREKSSLRCIVHFAIVVHFRPSKFRESDGGPGIGCIVQTFLEFSHALDAVLE